jgi:hypothetical protein
MFRDTHAMSDVPGTAGVSKYMVCLPDGRTFGPADIGLIVRWAGEGRVPQEAIIQAMDGAPPVRAVDHPGIRAVFLAPPIMRGPMPAPVEQDGGMSTLIPFRNGLALGAYYTSVFSLIPGLGLLLGPTAITLGIMGLRYAKVNPQAKGRAHAWVEIVLGTLTAIANIGLLIVIVIMGVRSQTSRS